jgi:threonine/homoserine/homoserine lactone efflux protein
MDAGLFPLTTLLTYSAAAALLVVAPGPGQALVIARSIEGGARAGVLTSLGLELGTLVHVVAAALGLSAILATSATAFNLVKTVVAAYLVFLCGSALWRAHVTATVDDRIAPPPADGRRVVLHAAVIGILNPKVALFFLAFLPQFVDATRGAVVLQFLVLGGILSAIGFAWDAMLAVTTSRARQTLSRSARFAAWRERLMGVVLVALGVRLLFVERR